MKKIVALIYKQYFSLQQGKLCGEGKTLVDQD